jgi:cyclomaltodextrinase / maltogenic alpha-amylase / neopullulanase
MLKKTAAALALTLGGVALAQSDMYANQYDKAVAGKYEAREKDWRNGPVVYQVLVDRFAPGANLQAKKALYPAPKTLNAWNVQPKRGTYSEQYKLWTHEIDFWGGDLASTASKLGYVQDLGVDVLYLNPIHLGYTNHKYDALDYEKVSPEFGTRDDVKKLAAETKKRGMKLVLDGVFNHVGRYNPKFEDAQKNPNSPYRQWFNFGPQYKAGYRGWWDVDNLPELNLESQAVRDHVYAKPDSVVRSYLRDGVDGWRLDVAFDIGFNYLAELTKAAHAEKPGSLVVGEIPNYPKEWFPSVDGVMHFGLRNLMIRTANRELDALSFSRMVDRLVSDADYEHILKSWVYLDNHDTFRLATTVPDVKARRIAQVLQFTLPGSPNLYYGTEVAMEGGDDPEQRGPMAWDRVEAKHPELAWTKQLIDLRKKNRALRVGDFRLAEASGNVIAFERYTDRIADSVLVLVNPSTAPVTTTVMVRNSKWMDGVKLIDQLAGEGGNDAFYQSMVTTVQLPAQSVRLYKPKTTPSAAGYTNFKRVQ